MTNRTSQGSRPTLMQRITAVFRSSRPISWVNTAFPYGAAYLLLGGSVDWVFIVGVLFFLIPYNIAMYGINDVFDYESDIRNPRKGGVEGAVLAKSLHPHRVMGSPYFRSALCGSALCSRNVAIRRMADPEFGRSLCVFRAETAVQRTASDRFNNLIHTLCVSRVGGWHDAE